MRRRSCRRYRPFGIIFIAAFTGPLTWRHGEAKNALTSSRTTQGVPQAAE
ncbi:MAG: hypothetical protein LBP80_01320 [Treponema sp.]|nr:hypothetical protein [Treponema sp.]